MFFRAVLSAKNYQLCRARAESSKMFDLEPLHASPTSSYKALIFHFCIYYNIIPCCDHLQSTPIPCTLQALHPPCKLLNSPRIRTYSVQIANMPLTVLSSADIHSLLLTLTRDDISELQYVVSKPTLPPLSQTLRLEPCLDSL